MHNIIDVLHDIPGLPVCKYKKKIKLYKLGMHNIIEILHDVPGLKEG